MVDLHWQLLGTESIGKATLSGITLTQDMLDLVRMSPLQWGAYILLTHTYMQSIYKVKMKLELMNEKKCNFFS